MFLELLAHANAIVLDAELIAATALGRTVLLGNADADHAACGSELDGVGPVSYTHLTAVQSWTMLGLVPVRVVNASLDKLWFRTAQIVACLLYTSRCV